MIVERIKNSPLPSNAYVICNESNHQCIIIDPGTPFPYEIINFCNNYNLNPEAIILTHFHFDHVWGANYLREKFGCPIICSRRCAEKLTIPQNYFNLLYFNDSSTFTIENIDVIINDNIEMDIAGNMLRFFMTPGHTDCSLCIRIGNMIFTGDTIMKGYKPVIKAKHGGSKNDFSNTLKDFFMNQDLNSIVYPGHDDCFVLSEVKSFYEKYIK